MKKIVNRLIQCILTLFIVSVLCFALTKAAPGDPVLTYVEPNMSEEYIQNLRESLGLTKPLYEQYFLWLGRILHGNFGNSLMNNRPVLTQMLERLPATVILMGTSMLLGFLIAIVLGLYSGKNKNGVLDKITSMFCYVGISIPTFWFGIMLIYLFSVHIRVSTVLKDTGFWDYVATLHMKKADFLKAIDMAPTIKPHRHTYLHEEKYREAAKKLVLEDEVLNRVLED